MFFSFFVRFFRFFFLFQCFPVFFHFSILSYFHYSCFSMFLVVFSSCVFLSFFRFFSFFLFYFSIFPFSFLHLFIFIFSLIHFFIFHFFHFFNFSFLRKEGRLILGGWGRCAVTGSRVHARPPPLPKGVTALPHPLQPLLDVAHTGSRADCSPPVCTLCFSAALQSVCQALACRPHESSKCGAALSCCEGRSSALLGLSQLADIGRCRRCLPMSRFLVCAVLPRVSRIIAVPPLPRVRFKSRCRRT